MKIKLLLLTVFLVQFGFAQVEKSVDLDDLNVVADWQKEFSESGQSIKTITQEQIAEMPVQSMDALLESLAGIDVRQRGVGGTQADLSLRGGTSDQVLVLLNGVCITDPQTGHHLLDLPIDFSEIDRIEVLHGSAARKYGNQAFSGAINIITKPLSKPALSTQLTAGSYNTFAQKVSLSGGTQKLNAFLSLARNTSDGYIDNTDYNHINAFGQVQYRENLVGQWDLQLGYQNKSFGSNGFYTLKYPNQFEHTQTKFASLKWSKKSGDFLWNAKASYRNHYDRFELFRDNQDIPVWYTSHNYHLTDVYSAKVSLSYFSSVGKFNFGLGTKYDHIYSTVLGDLMPQLKKNPIESGIDFTKEKARLINSLDIEYTRNFGPFNLAAGTSANQSNDYGWQWHYGTDISWRVKESTSIFVSMNTASRLPTYTDLYYQSAQQLANPDLKPEESVNFELGTKVNLSNINGQASVFHRRANNVIDWVLFPDAVMWQSQNLTRINTSGLEVDVKYLVDKYTLNDIQWSYSYLFNDKPLQNFDSKYALDYLKHHIHLSLNQQLTKKLSLQWQANYYDRAGTFTDFASGILTDYTSYFKLDLRANYKIKSSSVYLDFNNLTNTEYADFGGLTQPGIFVMAGIKYVVL